MLSSRVPANAEPNAWSRLIAERRAGGARLIDLTEANPTRVGLSGVDAQARAALAEADPSRYDPDARGIPDARAAVADYYAGRGTAVHPDEIVLTSGTSESYTHLFRLLAEPGDTVLVPAPSYPLFEPLAALEGVRLRPYRLAWDRGWHLDSGSFESAMRPGVRAVIVVQPNHPTGSCLTGEELAFAEALCERAGAALISDEVFGDFAWDADSGTPGAKAGRGEAGAGLASLLGARHVPTFVLSGLSKVCGMPQLKLGWIALAGPSAPRAEARQGLEWIADLFLSVGTPVQIALRRLLAARGPWQARVRERIAANLARLREAVARRPALDLLGGTGGWAAVLRVPRTRSEEEWTLELVRQGVVVHPGHFYDLEPEAHLVVSLIVPEREFAAGLERIEALVAGS